jgi:hypothetical protein
MGKILAILFVLLVGMPSIVFARVIPDKKRHSHHEIRDSVTLAKVAAEQGKAGVYRLEVSVEGDIKDYCPSLLYMGKYNRESSTPTLFNTSDSVSYSVDSLLVFPELTDKSDDFEKYTVGVNYSDCPSLFTSPIILETLPTAHGCFLNLSSQSISATSVIKVVIKGYYNNILVKEANWESIPWRDFMILMRKFDFELGNIDECYGIKDN